MNQGAELDYLPMSEERIVSSLIKARSQFECHICGSIPDAILCAYIDLDR